MNCEPGKSGYPLPTDFYEVFGAPHIELEGGRERMGYSRPLMRLSPAEYAEMRRRARDSGEPWGMPQYFCTALGEFFLHPAPDLPYVVLVQYLPQPKVW